MNHKLSKRCLDLSKGFDLVAEGYFHDSSKSYYKFAQLGTHSKNQMPLPRAGINLNDGLRRYLLHGHIGQNGQLVQVAQHPKGFEDYHIFRQSGGLSFCPGDVIPTYYHGKPNGRIVNPRAVFLDDGRVFLREDHLTKLEYIHFLNEEVSKMVGILFEWKELITDPKARPHTIGLLEAHESAIRATDIEQECDVV